VRPVLANIIKNSTGEVNNYRKLFVTLSPDKQYDNETASNLHRTHGISRYVQYKHLTKDQADWIDGFFKLNR